MRCGGNNRNAWAQSFVLISNVSENGVPLKLDNMGTSFFESLSSEQNWPSYRIFVETFGAHTLLCPVVLYNSSLYTYTTVLVPAWPQNRFWESMYYVNVIFFDQRETSHITFNSKDDLVNFLIKVIAISHNSEPQKREKYVSQKEERNKNDAKNSGHCVLPAMPKGSTCTLLGPRFVIAT